MEARELNWKESIIHIVAWFCSTALVILDVLMVSTAALAIAQVIAAASASTARRTGALVGRATEYGWTIEALDRGGLLLLGCIGIALAVIFEYYFRAGLQKGLFIKRVARVVAIELVVFLVAWGVQALLLG